MPRKQTRQEFIERSIKIFGDQLDYSKVNYINNLDKIILICKKHGEFTISPKDHLCYKTSCGICSGFKYNTNSFIEKAHEIHGDKFLYHKVNYINSHSPVIIVCKIHLDFKQSPRKHLFGSLKGKPQGCPKCKKSARKNLDYVIKMGSFIHNNKYDYSKVVFTKMFDKVIIICPKHGEFNQTPAGHINCKHGCSICMVGTSKKENKWLNTLKIPDDTLHRTVSLRVNGKKLIVDGFDPATNTIYEFYGDFWHGNPHFYKSTDMNNLNHKSFGQLYEKTLNREKLIIEDGYKLVSIWEEDFDKQTQMDKNKR